MNLFVRIYQFTKEHPRISLAIFFVLIFFLILVFLAGNAAKKPAGGPSPSPTSSTLIALTPPNVFPQSGDLEAAGTKISISLFFDTPIDPTSVRVEANPVLPFKASVLADYPNRIILVPQTPWIAGTKYTIKVLRGIKSSDGTKELRDDFIINYNVIDVPTPQFLE